MKKKRLPIEQLREAGKTAHQMLVDKGIFAKTSIIDEIMSKEDSPTLPGIPPYLPHKWTITTAQRILRNLLIMWREETLNDTDKRENITEFFKYVISILREEEKRYKKEMKNVPKLFKSIGSIPVIKDVFSPLRKKENTEAIHRFLIDSFAVSIMIKKNYDVSTYANWFLDWTEEMYNLWSNKENNG